MCRREIEEIVSKKKSTLGCPAVEKYMYCAASCVASSQVGSLAFENRIEIALPGNSSFDTLEARQDAVSAARFHSSA